MLTTIYSLEDVKKMIQFFDSTVLLVSPDMKKRIEDSIKLPDNVRLRTSPFLEGNKAYLLRAENDIIKPRIGFDRREECPEYDEVFGCADCAAEHCDYY